MAHLPWGKNMLTPMLKLCLVVSLSCDPGQQQIFEFDVNIFFFPKQMGCMLSRADMSLCSYI